MERHHDSIFNSGQFSSEQRGSVKFSTSNAEWACEDPNFSAITGVDPTSEWVKQLKTPYSEQTDPGSNLGFFKIFTAE